MDGNVTSGAKASIFNNLEVYTWPQTLGMNSEKIDKFMTPNCWDYYQYISCGHVTESHHMWSRIYAINRSQN